MRIISRIISSPVVVVRLVAAACASLFQLRCASKCIIDSVALHIIKSNELEVYAVCSVLSTLVHMLSDMYEYGIR